MTQIEPALDRISAARILAVAAAALATWFQWWRPVARFDLVAAVALAIGAWPILKEAFHALRARRMTMELSMLVALGAAFAIGESVTALVIALFVLVAEVLERLAVGHGRRAIGDLMTALPRLAFVVENETVVERPIDSVAAGEIVLVKPGALIPVDGEVLRGASHVDQAAITGESMPSEKLPGGRVFAGTVNQSGTLEVRAERLGRATAFGRIVDAVERADRFRAPVQKTADRLAGILVYGAIACAALTWLITRDARSTISVIVVAGACGIAAGTPLAILGAVGQAARKGVIAKGGLALEALWSVDTIVFDKTGTLSLGDPKITAIQPEPGVSEAEILEAAATAERSSEHPLAKAILTAAGAREIRGRVPDRFEYLPGKGIVATCGEEDILVGSAAFLAERGIAVGAPSGIAVARAGRFLGTLLFADVLRPEAAGAVRALKAMGIRTILLTGDSEEIARRIGREAGVEEVCAELLPDQKLDRVKELMAGGRRVGMVGDGVNDAPALMQANVGIAMGSGTEIAREAAQVVLVGNNLSSFADTVATARRCRRIIWANLYGTLAVDAAGVALSAAGLLNPLAAAAVHVTSELAFILNSARLLPGRTKPPSA